MRRSSMSYRQQEMVSRVSNEKRASTSPSFSLASASSYPSLSADFHLPTNLDIIYTPSQAPPMLPWQSLPFHILTSLTLEFLSERFEVGVPSPNVPRSDRRRDLDPIGCVSFRVEASLVGGDGDALDRHSWRRE